MSDFKVTRLEYSLFQNIKRCLSDDSSLSIHEQLYEAGLEHGKKIIKDKIKENFRAGTEERQKMFPESRHYGELIFVSKPIQETEIDQISSFLMKTIQKHYKDFIKVIDMMGINKIGPVLLQLRSKKVLAVILYAYFPPANIDVKRQFDPLIMVSIKNKADDQDCFLELINKFRNLFNKFFIPFFFLK